MSCGRVDRGVSRTKQEPQSRPHDSPEAHNGDGPVSSLGGTEQYAPVPPQMPLLLQYTAYRHCRLDAHTPPSETGDNGEQVFCRQFRPDRQSLNSQLLPSPKPLQIPPAQKRRLPQS